MHVSFEDSPKKLSFVPRQTCPRGVEIVKGDYGYIPVESYNVPHEDGHSQLGLWFNAKMGAEELFDSDVDAIDALETAAEPISDELRTIRCQIAALEVTHYRFPESITLILKGISAGKADVSFPTGDYAPWWSPLEAVRKGKHAAIKTVVRAFAGGNDPAGAVKAHPEYEDDILRTHEHLGEINERKKQYATRLLLQLSTKDIFTKYTLERLAPDIKAIRDTIENADKWICAELESTLDDDQILHNISAFRYGISYTNYFRIIENICASICEDKWVEKFEIAAVEKNLGDIRKRYTHALGAYLNGRPKQASIDKLGEEASAIVEEVYNLAGTVNAQKKWLLACLWKTLVQPIGHSTDFEAANDNAFLAGLAEPT